MMDQRAELRKIALAHRRAEAVNGELGDLIEEFWRQTDYTGDLLGFELWGQRFLLNRHSRIVRRLK